MVKHLATIAMRAMSIHRGMVPNLTRIQYGFMTDQNREHIEKTLDELQDMLRDMREALQHPPPPDDKSIPLK